MRSLSSGRTARAVFHLEVLSVKYQELPKAAMGRLLARPHPSDGGGGLAEETPYGSEVEGPYPRRNAPHVRVCNTLGAIHRQEKPDSVGPGEGWQQAPPASDHSDCGSVRNHRDIAERAVPHDGLHCPMPRSSRKR